MLQQRHELARLTVGRVCSGDEEDEYEDADNAPMSVVKMQVGLLGSARELQRDLNRMANNLDTSTPQGLHYLLTETVLALRRNPQYAVYGAPLCCFFPRRNLIADLVVSHTATAMSEAASQATALLPGHASADAAVHCLLRRRLLYCCLPSVESARTCGQMPCPLL